MSKSRVENTGDKERLQAIQEIARAVGSTFEIDTLLDLIVGKVTEIMAADRSTLYVMDPGGEELWTKVIQADEIKEIRLRVGDGVAGWVAQHGEILNIKNAYDDSRFQPAFDKHSGYKTNTILCAPMRDNQQRITGVVQVLNKKDSAFNEDDEAMLLAIASQASIAIENTKLYRSLLEKNRHLVKAQKELERRVSELDLLLDLEQSVNAAAFLTEFLQQVARNLTKTIGARAASIVLRTNGNDDYFVLDTKEDGGAAVRRFKLAPGSDIAGWVIDHGKPAIIDAPTSDARCYASIDEHLHFAPDNILCVPLNTPQGCIGAAEIFNKLDAICFDEGDLRLMMLIAGRVGQAVDLAQTKEKRIQENRLAAIGQLLSSVLHDLKTPMTIISGYAQLMVQTEQEPQREAYADLIQNQFDTLSKMTKEVLSFAKGESNLLVRRVYLDKFLQDIRNALETEFGDKEISLQINAAYSGVAMFDEDKMRRVFHNIGRNAAEAMPSGGTFSIDVGKNDTDALKFVFKDSGCGIPIEIQDRVFETFATSGKENGTGLGLAIVKKIVEEHQGHVALESAVGRGTTFTVSIPQPS